MPTEFTTTKSRQGVQATERIVALDVPRGFACSGVTKGKPPAGKRLLSFCKASLLG